MEGMTRRSLLHISGGILGTAALGLPMVEGAADQESGAPNRKLKVVVTGGHPDDPQSGCGGTMALYAKLSHEVVAVFLTRGEKGIPGTSDQETSAIRSAEALKSCEILGARAVFANQVDANTEVNPTRYKEFRQIIDAENPDVLFTHWPIDTHPDHRAASLLSYDAWIMSGKKFALYYYEVELGSQTQTFSPTHFVNITATEELKRAACFAHQSTIKGWWPLHEEMHRFRGLERSCKAAEAFVRHAQDPDEIAVAASAGR
jgi:LmbE family N-acetylglucosaminyl deacetylase